MLRSFKKCVQQCYTQKAKVEGYFHFSYKESSSREGTDKEKSLDDNC